MSVMLANILTWVCLVLFIAIEVYLKIRKPLKVKYYHEFHEDELIRTTKTTNTTNVLYFTHGQTLSYIKKYIICKASLDQYVICNFAKPMSEITYYIICYNKAKKPIDVIKVFEKNVEYSSRIIPLTKNTVYVNVIAGKVNDKVINSNVIKPYSIRLIKLYSLLKSLAYLTGTIAACNLIYLFMGGIYEKWLFEDFSYVVILIGILVTSLLLYLITQKSLRKKNISSRLGGVIEYEFL